MMAWNRCALSLIIVKSRTGTEGEIGGVIPFRNAPKATVSEMDKMHEESEQKDRESGGGLGTLATWGVWLVVSP